MSSDLEFFVYPFANRQFATIPVQKNDKDQLFGLTLADDDLMKRTYVQKIKDNSSVSKALTADRQSALKGAYITHILSLIHI